MATPSSCPMLRRDPVAVAGAPPSQGRPLDTLPWNAANLTATEHVDGRHFTPVGVPPDDFEAAIHAAQFPIRCENYLLVEDDMYRQGLGFTSLFWTSALLLAIRANRVLLEIPVNHSWPSSHFHRQSSHDQVAPHRWCTEWPFTLQCFYRPWTHCPAPPLETHAHPVTRHHKVDGSPQWSVLSGLPEVEKMRVVRMKLSWLTANLAKHVPSSLGRSVEAANVAAGRFLFRPRPWVETISQCVMARAQLRPQSFISVFIRDSHEKRVELAQHGHGMPSKGQYEWITLVAAVNQHIASFAGVYVGLASSAWTPYLAMFMRGPTQPLGYARTMHYLCCDCRSRDFYGVNNTPANVHMLVAEGSAKEHVHRLELEVVGSRGTEERSGSASSQRCVVHDLRAMRRCSVVHAKPCRNDER